MQHFYRSRYPSLQAFSEVCGIPSKRLQTILRKRDLDRISDDEIISMARALDLSFKACQEAISPPIPENPDKKHIAELEREVQKLNGELAYLNEWGERIVREHNDMIHMLNDLFDLHVYSADIDSKGEALWTVADSKTEEKITTLHRDSTEAYREAIKKRIADPRL